MGTTPKTMIVTDSQDEWIEAQIEGGDLTDDSENVRDLIGCDQARSAEIDAIREASIRGEQSGDARPFR